MRNRLVFLTALLIGTPVAAQDPMSAINWLSESVREKPVFEPAVDDIAESAGTDEIATSSLGEISKDTVGLLPTAVSGLPRNFWGNTSVDTVRSLLAQQTTDSLPEVLNLLYTILLAELDAPVDDSVGADLLLTRADKLLDLGAMDQAQALLERAGPTETEIFRRWFDLSLLTGHEDRACTAMRAAPGFAPTMPARIFCLARGGDWNAAALTLATGESLEFVTKEEADLLARFLDPELFGDEADLPPPARLTPLTFVMREAIGQPRPTGALPLAFLAADLGPSGAWRNKIEAAERLVRSQALNPGYLFDLYTEKRPAASGGIWDRVHAIQAFDVALLSGEVEAVEAALPPAYQAMQSVGLEVPMASHFAERLERFDLQGDAKVCTFKLRLLSPDYESAVTTITARTDKERFLLGVAIGDVSGLTAPDTIGTAIAAAFTTPFSEGTQYELVQEGNLGEAILRAMLLLADESFADPGDVQTALSTLRGVGLEDEARRVAIQLLLLERRG